MSTVFDWPVLLIEAAIGGGLAYLVARFTDHR